MSKYEFKLPPCAAAIRTFLRWERGPPPGHCRRHPRRCPCPRRPRHVPLAAFRQIYAGFPAALEVGLAAGPGPRPTPPGSEQVRFLGYCSHRHAHEASESHAPIMEHSKRRYAAPYGRYGRPSPSRDGPRQPHRTASPERQRTGRPSRFARSRTSYQSA